LRKDALFTTLSPVLREKDVVLAVEERHRFLEGERQRVARAIGRPHPEVEVLPALGSETVRPCRFGERALYFARTTD